MGRKTKTPKAKREPDPAPGLEALLAGDEIPAGAELHRRRVVAALEKRRRGVEPTRDENRALRRFFREREERLRWLYYERIPQKHWREMSGRPTKVLHDQQAAYRIPFGGATINLREVARAFHDFLAANKTKLAVDGADPLLADGPETPALERLRKITGDLKELELEERRANLIRREDVHRGLTELGQILRSAAETLRRSFGMDAHAVLDEALSDFERMLKTWAEADGPENGECDRAKAGKSSGSRNV